jgi:hypothetical protein
MKNAGLTFQQALEQGIEIPQLRLPFLLDVAQAHVIQI